MLNLHAGQLKYALIIFCGFIFYRPAQAQFVNIPDDNFVYWLINSNVSGCLNAQVQLDTTCPALLTETTVNCSPGYIINLDGIQYFKNLRYLDCSYNKIDSLIDLPASLISLDCHSNDSLLYIKSFPNKLQTINFGGNRLDSIPALPDSLRMLICAVNKLTMLPNLPNHLDTLNCSTNLLTTLPPFPSSLHGLVCLENQLITIPYGASLQYLICHLNNITSLPVYDSLQLLDCAYNHLQRLPILPGSLIDLDCSYNNIDSIMVLPDNIKWLACQNNVLKFIGFNLPDSLQDLACYYNQLNSLPPFPKGLSTIVCAYNSLTQLPSLPDSVNVFNCNNNPYLKCLPEIKRINYLFFDSTAITCLPNYGNVTSSSPRLDSLPLCGANNTNGCPVFTSVVEIKTLNFSLYPNPANNHVLLTFKDLVGDVFVQLIDITGREMVNIRVDQPTYDLSVEGLPDGIYFVRIIDGNGDTGMKKLVIER